MRTSKKIPIMVMSPSGEWRCIVTRCKRGQAMRYARYLRSIGTLAFVAEG
jgi:hypothetical protein